MLSLRRVRRWRELTIRVSGRGAILNDSPPQVLGQTSSRLEVIPVTALLRKSSDTCIMERVVDEAEYVLSVLHRMRNEVAADPKLFDPDAQERIDEAIDRLQRVVRGARSRLTTFGVEQEVKAA